MLKTTASKLCKSRSTYCKQDVHGQYQKACFHGLEESPLHVKACHDVFVDHVQAVAHSTRLLQAVAPVQGALLKRAERTIVDGQYTVQMRLQMHRLWCCMDWYYVYRAMLHCDEPLALH